MRSPQGLCATPRYRSTMPSSLHRRLLDDLGSSIVAGRLARGEVVLAGELAQRYDVSLSVVREVIRALQANGLVESVKRLGVRVLSADRWNVYSADVIRWRLDGPDRAVQLRSLTELRTAVEPLAADLAARHAPASVREELMTIAARMRELGRAGDLEGFLDLDIAFHALVLRGSGNEMLAALDGAVAAVLRARTEHGLMPAHPHEEALQWHVDVADGVQAGRPARAAAAMRAILGRTTDEVSSIWDGAERAPR